MKKKLTVKKKVPYKRTRYVGPIEDKPITDREQKFIEVFLVKGNGHGPECAREAGYSDKGNGCAVKSCRLLKQPNIVKELKKQALKRNKRVGIDQDRVLLEMGRVAFYDVADLFDDNDNLLPVLKVNENTRRAITGVTVSDIGGVVTTKYKLADKTKSLDMLAKHLNLYKENNKLDVVDPIRTLMESISGKSIGAKNIAED